MWRRRSLSVVLKWLIVPKEYYMKALVLLFAFLFMTSVWATVRPTDPVVKRPNVVYTCTGYTANKVFSNGTTSDNHSVSTNTKVVQTEMGFDILAGKAFKLGKVLTNSQIGLADEMAGDRETLLLKREDDAGFPYFIIYQFDDAKIDKLGKPTKGSVIGLVVLGNCKAD
jgi:hypothetical protein